MSDCSTYPLYEIQRLKEQITQAVNRLDVLKTLRFEESREISVWDLNGVLDILRKT